MPANFPLGENDGDLAVFDKPTQLWERGDASSAVQGLGRVLYVDGTQSPATPNGSIGSPFTTIGAALAAATALVPTVAAPVTIIVADDTYNETISVPSSVSITAANAGGQVCRITPVTSMDTVVTLASNSEISGFRIQGASGAGGVGIGTTAATSAPFARANTCLVVDCETGYQADGAGTFLFVANCLAVRPGAGVVMTDGYRAVNGGQVHGFISRAVGASGSLLTGAGWYASGAGSECHNHAGAAIFCTNGLQVENDGVIEGHTPRVASCLTGQRLGPGASGTLRTSGLIGVNTADILADGATATLEMISGEAQIENVTLRSDTVLDGDLAGRQTDIEEPKRHGLSDNSTGLPGFPRTLGAGQGLPTPVEMVCFTFDNSAGSGSKFTDVTAAARSRSGSTVTFPASTQTTDAILWGVPRQFGGVIANLVTAMSADGFLRWERWDGAAWTEMPPGGTRGSGVSGHTSPAEGSVYLANVVWEAVQNQRVHFNPEINSAWVSSTGVLDQVPTTASATFWVRVRPDTLPTTNPVIEQFQIIYASTLLTPAGLLLDGNSRVRDTISVYQNLFEPGPNSPANQDLRYSANVTVGFQENNFVNGAIDQAGLVVPLPLSFDLSGPLILDWEWQPNNGTGGDVEWELYYGVVDPTDILARSGSGSLAEFTDFNVIAAGAVDVGIVSQHTIRIPNANPSNGDALFFMMRRDATAGNPDDTFAGNAAVRRITLNAIRWRLGENIS